MLVDSFSNNDTAQRLKGRQVINNVNLRDHSTFVSTAFYMTLRVRRDRQVPIRSVDLVIYRTTDVNTSSHGVGVALLLVLTCA